MIEGKRRGLVKALAVGCLERLLGLLKQLLVLRDTRKGCFRYIECYQGSAVDGPDSCISNNTLEEQGENGV